MVLVSTMCDSVDVDLLHFFLHCHGVKGGIRLLSIESPSSGGSETCTSARIELCCDETTPLKGRR